MFDKCKKNFSKNRREDKIIHSDMIFDITKENSIKISKDMENSTRDKKIISSNATFNKIEKNTIKVSIDTKENLNNSTLLKQNDAKNEPKIVLDNKKDINEKNENNHNAQSNNIITRVYLPDIQQTNNNSPSLMERVWQEYYNLYIKTEKISIKSFLARN